MTSDLDPGRKRTVVWVVALATVGMVFAVVPTFLKDSAFMHHTTAFGIFRFVIGAGHGALIATTGVLVAQIAPGKATTSS